MGLIVSDMINKITFNQTYKEIMQQPYTLYATFETIRSNKEQIVKFLRDRDIDRNSKIIFSGAGSSAYIADSIVCLYKKDGFLDVRSVPTTDIITNPAFYLDREKRVVDISFGRSGDSPESVAAYDIINKFCNNPSHIIITCNSKGALAEKARNNKNTLALIMPDLTNDRSLVMTSSFTSMMLAGLLLKNIKVIEEEKNRIEEAVAFGKSLLENPSFAAHVSKMTELPIERAVFLGSGPLKGIARECNLKLQEMTDGRIICEYDSFMGLRHGPKAVIKHNTMVVYLLSDENYTNMYEFDLIKQVNTENHPALQVVVSRSKMPVDFSDIVDMELNDPTSFSLADNEYKYIPFVFVGQLLGYSFCTEKGLNPDNPSVSGTISRVVNGVKIYEYKI
ncbi:MAG: SIS domain-containing protein [Bacteroidales bacterium]|jgi:tagatose-6-phosphate ketose/aldose isomerase|nr:SIS domain-containing protein [Bacteroidales bacterium]